MKFLITCILCLLSLNAFTQQFIPTQIRPSGALNLGANRKDASVVNPIDIDILGIGGANDITNSQNLGGSLALGAYIAFQKKKDNTRWSHHAVYILYNARAGNSADTSVVARTFLFPDIGKRDLTLGYEWLIKLGSGDAPWRLIPFVEFSFNRNIYTPSKDSILKFHSTNFSIGAKIDLRRDFTLGAITKQFGFTFYPYYQLIATEPKDFSIRNEMLGEKALPPTFHTIGFNTSLQVAELGLFANYKQILNNTENIGNRDLQGGILVVGALISTSIFKLN
ncbi:hypothetical protein SAMN05428988_4114 [Chitinophaga sp. YR573]|uniref:hypothetical protein n=1 Tax=Chitinophaga sp. YR573 TaxID=1881040 RepID=UPI0008B95363|nr:hypothetical protein [Chitinophaga sp. YR573]SEW34349.1 hypothetical protein SAMN05428988_4114 [Chitinophaga sp. YR573]